MEAGCYETMKNADHIETAFLHLAFALKLWHFFSSTPPDKEVFDIALTVDTPGSRVCLPHGQFERIDDLIIATENNINICFGAVAITLWEALNETDKYKPGKLPTPLNTQEEKIAALVYMIRCCFAHGMAIPKWEIRDRKYRIVYKIGNKTVDLTLLDGQVFSYDSIGGYETLWFLRYELENKGMLK
jgi:hypothetical protein